MKLAIKIFMWFVCRMDKCCCSFKFDSCRLIWAKYFGCGTGYDDSICIKHRKLFHTSNGCSLRELDFSTYFAFLEGSCCHSSNGFYNLSKHHISTISFSLWICNKNEKTIQQFSSFCWVHFHVAKSSIKTMMNIWWLISR